MNYQKELDKLLATLTASKTDLNQLSSTANATTTRPSLLLHACCGPCSSYVLEYLVQYFDITVYYYNPNIYPATEYERRLQELKDLYKRFPPALEGHVNVVEAPYDPEEFYAAVGTRQEPELAREAEKGERCRRCYEFRLRRAWEYASAHGFDYFCTTLSISPFKDAEKINVIGMALAGEGASAVKGDLGAAERASAVAAEVKATVEGKVALAEGALPVESEVAGVEGGPDGGNSTPKWLPSDFKKNNGFKRSLEISQEYDLYRQQYCGCIYSMNNMVK